MKKFFKVLFAIVLVLLAFLCIINLIPPKKLPGVNPFISTDGEVMIAAHRGGADMNPDNTMMAFEEAVLYSDILEMDVCLTKDNELVIIHDLEINDFCDVEKLDGVTENQYVRDYNYADLLKYNFGHQFEASDGTTPYKDYFDNYSGQERIDKIKEMKLNLVRLDDLFKSYYETYPEMLYIIEIKNSGEDGKIAADIMNELLTVKYPNLVNKVVIGTFNQEIEDYLKEKYPNIMRGAATGAATKFVITEILNVNLFENGDYTCLQLPMENEVTDWLTLNLIRKDFVKRAHRKNVAIQYWTIHTREEMEALIEIKCDCIMTDNPKLLYEVLQEKKNGK